MKCIINPFNSCYSNIGSEEFFLSRFDEEIFYLYINSPCIVVGRNQNTYSEINQTYVRENQIDVVRRLSGGGAVYHDYGNLNYGFIVKNENNDIDEIFRKYTSPIIKVLQNLGVDARFSGRNDIVIDDKKISGVAQYHTLEKVLLHGTLLFDSDIKKVSASLNADPRKFQDKSVKSVKSRVSNIKPFLSIPLNIIEFRDIIVKEILSQFPDSNLYELTDNEEDEILKLALEKYSTWNWVYGISPDFKYQHALKYDKGIIDIGLNIDSGMIAGLSIYGDFFGKRDISELKEIINNIPYQRISVETALSRIKLEDYIFGLSKETFIDSMFSNSL